MAYIASYMYIAHRLTRGTIYMYTLFVVHEVHCTVHVHVHIHVAHRLAPDMIYTMDYIQCSS